MTEAARYVKLVIAALCLSWGQAGVAADEPKPVDPASPEARKSLPANLRTPQKAVQFFLDALKANNREQLAEATSHHALTEPSDEKKRKLFKSILDKSVSDSELRKLVSEFDGYEIKSVYPRNKGATWIAVVVVKPGTNGQQFKRMFSLMHAKLGWKITDFSDPNEVKEK
jgi:hypothetical protein